ncbi:MAG: NAD-dependent deacylase [Candidatus Zixiibacteriota bacterium]|nr:MAG: NAD-dependent deacylase [candidate division Zixibacteria bacterium]
MIHQLIDIIRQVSRGAVLTGAGMSAESGVPTFRGKEGLWGKFRAEELATMNAFMSNPKLVWEWYNWRRELMGSVQPNSGHHALVDLNEYFDHFVVITQNVDNLHFVAGSPDVLELHGNIQRNKCSKCESPCGSDIEIDPDNIPCCKKCGGQIRPDVVWFGEMLPQRTIERAFAEAEQAELFFSIGTSAIVHPAASLPLVAKRSGATLVEINPEETELSRLADFRFDRPSGEFLPELVGLLRNSNAP